MKIKERAFLQKFLISYLVGSLDYLKEKMINRMMEKILIMEQIQIKQTSMIKGLIM